MKRRRRNSEPRGRLLELPLREYSVEAFPRDTHGEWMLHLVVNGRDVKDVVRDPQTGLAKTFATKPAANRWWESHGQAFTDAMGKAGHVRTRKANPGAGTYYHVVGPGWEPGDPIESAEQLHQSGLYEHHWPDMSAKTYFRSPMASQVSLFNHLADAHALAHELGGDYSRILRVDLPPDIRVITNEEGFAAVWGQIDPEYVTEVIAAQHRTRNTERGTTFHRPGPAGGGGRNDVDFAADFRREARELAGDPTLATPAMRRHLRAMAAQPGRGLRRGNKRSTKEWIEFAGYAPNHTTEIDGVALSGDLPGVRIDVLEGVGAKTGRVVKIAAGQKDLWLVWFKSGERFALTGGPSSMRELARDFQRLGEPVYLTKVDYVAPRYPVPVGVKRSKSNRDMSIAYTHDVENKTLLTWNGQTDPKRAKFDIRVQGKRRRWVNRSGLTF